MRAIMADVDTPVPSGQEQRRAYIERRKRFLDAGKCQNQKAREARLAYMERKRLWREEERRKREEQFVKLKAEYDQAVGGGYKIMVFVCDVHNVTRAALLGSRRHASIARVRQIGYYLAYELTGLSFPMIGRIFNKDHTSVLHGVRKITQLRAEDSKLDKYLSDLESRLKAMGIGVEE